MIYIQLYDLKSLLNLFGMVEFYGISTIVDFKIPNPADTDIYSIYDL